MRSPFWTIAVAAWALVGMPSLCTAGLLVHPCDSESAAHTDHEENNHHDHSDDDGCRHESDCAQDPCSELSIRNDFDESTNVPGSPLLHVSVDFINDLSQWPGPSLALIIRDHLPKSTMPCPESVLPLLI